MLECILAILLGRASHPVAFMGRMSIPAKGPMEKDPIQARWAQDTVPNDIINSRLGVNATQHPVRITMQRHV